MAEEKLKMLYQTPLNRPALMYSIKAYGRLSTSLETTLKVPKASTVQKNQHVKHHEIWNDGQK